MDSLDKLMGESISRKVELIRTKIGNFLINIQDVIGTSLKITGVWESWLIVVYGKVIQKEWTVIDAGANIGCHTIPFARLCKKVYAFEPQREVYNNLCYNIFLNGLDNIIIPIRKGLGDKVEKKQLWSIHHEDFNNGTWNWGGRGIEQENCSHDFNPDEYREHDQIDVVPLDSYNFDRCDLIKMDIQGYELFALKGAKNTIEKFKPIILLENGIHDNSELEQNIEVKKYLISLGYEFYRMNFDTKLIPSMKQYNNDDCFVLHPESEFYSFTKLAMEQCPDGYNFKKETE